MFTEVHFRLFCAVRTILNDLHIHLLGNMTHSLALFNQRYHSVSQPSTSTGIHQSVEPPPKVICSQIPTTPNVTIQGMTNIQTVQTEPPAPHPQQYMAAIPVQPVIAGGFTAPTATVSTAAEVSCFLDFSYFVYYVNILIHMKDNIK